ncbi:MAG: DUF4434 domain-containing protein, partial [Clostridia bacterium]|nr:DUF4434 domain-containing protein [Clostridia bacterium]
MKKTLSVILAIAMIMSCFTGISFNVSAATTEQRLNLNTEYAFSYPSYKNVTGDNEGKNLTDGNMNTTSVFTIKNETYNYSDTSSFPGKHFNLYDEGRDPHFYVQNDFGFPSKLTKVEITFNTSSGAVLPSSVEIIISNDGYNYTIYPKQTVAKVTSGNRTTYTVTIGEDILAMGIKAYVYAPDNSMVSINEVSVIGVPNENERILLSQGKPYIWEKCKNISGYDNDSSRLLLTDGIVGKAGETTKFTGRTPDGTDEFSLSSVSELTIDLEEVKNISEVQFITMTSSPDYVVARYSEDGVNYYDLGQSYAIGRWGANGEFAEFAVMRNHTVKARYVKVLFRGKAILSEVKIYGCENAVSEMDYGFVERDDIIAHTNVAKGKSAKLASTTKSGVVDGSYNSGYADISKNTTKELIIDLSSSTANVNSVMLYFQADSSYYAPTKVETYISSNGSTYTKVESNFITHQTSDKISYQQYFDSQAVRKVKFTITASSKVARLYEAEVYAGQPQLPLIRGGFFQLQALTSNAENPDIKYTDTMWYLLVKGMKELGMDYIVLQFGAGYEGSMMFDGPRLKARGFTKGVGYGSADPYKAIFEASEKLGMKVFVGTVGGPYAGPEKITAAGGYTYINELLDIAEDAVRDIYDLYSGYKSFAGYYLADETCDKWLNQTNGVDYYRAIYKGQSDIIRQVDPTRPIMVCPAIWRNGGASAAETNLYNMLKPATTGGKPIVDIVAAQDCLGRNWSFGGDNFYVSDSVYTLYESYAQAMANATKRAGAEYWTDAEIFDCIYHTKNYSDTLDTMHLASKYSNGTIIFDVSHYFTEFSEKELANWTRLEVSHTISKYAQRYYSTYKDLNNVGRNAKALTSYNMKIQGYSYPNGTKVPSDQKISYTEKAPNMSGSIVKSEWAEFNPFVRNNNGNNAAYSMMWDEDKLYFAIDTDDTTVNAGSWGGGDAIILGFNPNSEQVIYTHGPNNINAKYQPNFYQLIFFRKANGTWALETSRCYKGNSALEISDDLITYKGVTDANGHAQFMIAIDWDLFGVSDSYIGDGMKMAYYAYYTFFDGTYESSGTSGETYKTKNLSVLLDGKKVSADPSSSGSSDFINVVAGNTPYTRNKPKMSGVIDKSIWPKFTNFYYNKNENDAAYSVMWDYDNLYIAIDTNDTTLNPGSWGSGDTVVMCLSPNEVERISTRDADPSIYTYFYQLVFFRQEDGSFLLDTARSKGGNSTLSLNNDNISYYDILDNDGHVQLVCAISWDVFGLPSGVLNDGMAFDYNFYYSFYDGASDLQYSDGSTTTYYAAIDSVLHETDFAGPQPSMNYVLNYTKKAPTKTDVIESEWPGFNEFLNGGNNSYSMMWDNDKLYIAIRTKDKVIETGKWGVPDQLGIFLDTNRTYFTYAKVADPAATPNASFMVFYGDAANNNFKWGREAHGNSVSDYANSNGSYVVNQSFDEYGRVQFVITIDYKKFLGIESLENGDKLYFGAMYGTVKANTSYKKISNSNDYIACESFELAGKEEVEPTEEVTPEEPTPEEPTPEEPTPEEVTPEVPTPEEPTPEEPTP